MLKKMALLACALTLSFAPILSNAALSPLAVSILPPLQFPRSGFNIAGARVSALWGQHLSVSGIDAGGLVNMTNQSFTGIGIAGGMNWNKGTATIVFLQAAGLANINVNKANIYGVQIAALVNSNVAESSILGVQLAAVNLSSHTHVMGLQAGLYNQARTVSGFQIGLINQTDILHGIQIGLLNFHRQGTFAVAPILNIGF